MGDGNPSPFPEALHTPLPDGERILPHFLQEQGYFTGHMAKTHYGPNAERQFQWYSPKIAETFPAFLDSAGTRPFFLWVGFHEPRERNWHDCDEHQRAVRSKQFKLIRTDAYTALPLCTAADIGASPAFQALRARGKAGRLTPAQRRLFKAPRARLELYNLAADPGSSATWRTTPATAGKSATFASKIPPLRNAEVPPPAERWGRQGPS